MKRDQEELLTLRFLEAIDRRSDVTQRHLANEFGVALGLANSYIKRCIRKGLVKIQQAPANRYLYYLTPRGFAEKSRLTAEYFAASFDYYHRAGQSLRAALELIEQQSAARVMFAGVSELAEIASVRALDFEFEVLGTFDPQSTLSRFIGRPVWHTFEQAPEFDAILFTDISTAAHANYELLAGVADTQSIYVPDILVMVTEHDS